MQREPLGGGTGVAAERRHLHVGVAAHHVRVDVVEVVEEVEHVLAEVSQQLIVAGAPDVVQVELAEHREEYVVLYAYSTDTELLICVVRNTSLLMPTAHRH